MRVFEYSRFVFWMVITGVMLMGLFIIDEIPIKIIKLIVIAQLIIYSTEKIMEELKPKEEKNATNQM